jgi:hypothetical protein
MMPILFFVSLARISASPERQFRRTFSGGLPYILYGAPFIFLDNGQVVVLIVSNTTKHAHGNGFIFSHLPAILSWQ